MALDRTIGSARAGADARNALSGGERIIGGRAGKGRGDPYAYTSYGVRPNGLSGGTAGLSSWAGNSVLVCFGCSIAGLYTLLICVLVAVAVLMPDDKRGKAALKVLKIIAGPLVSIGQPPGGAS